MLYAHVVKGVVRAVESVDEGLVPGEDVFTPAYAKELVPCDNRVREGMVYDGAAFSEPEPETWKRKDLQEWIRTQRTSLLSACDWTQMLDADLTEPKREAWRTYRQALRDLPKTAKDAPNPAEVEFPVPPEG